MSWPRIKLRELITLTGGHAFKSGDFEAIGIPLIRIGTANSGTFKTSEFVFLPQEYKFKYSKYLVNPGDLLITLTGTVGKGDYGNVCEATDGYDSYLLNQRVAKININSIDLSKRYLYLFLATPEVKKNLTSLSRGVRQANIKNEDILDLEIPLPPLDEQKRIAAILDKADAIRRKRQQAIKLTDDFLRSVFLDMFGDPISNPKEWEVKKLKEISSKISSGNTPKGGSKNYVDEGITFMRSQNVWKNKLLLDDVVYIDEKTHESMSKSSLKRKDILMTKTGRINTENSSLGRAALYLGEDGKANLNGHVYFIRLVENILHEFVVFILTTIEYRDYIRSVCVGGIDKRQLNKNHLEEFPIIYPPKKMQEQFVKKVNVASNMLEKAKSGLKESEQMFNGLSQKAFSGEL